MEELGKRATTPGTIYLTGGATALLLGIRNQTIDIDIKMDPEPGGVFEAINDLKNGLDLNIELASPDHFIPRLPGWQDRSVTIGTFSRVLFKHFDYYSQALSKIERGFDRDIGDVTAFCNLGLVDLGELERLALAIRADLIRYPAIDADDFYRKLTDFISKRTG
jgi:hypothetical protein